MSDNKYAVVIVYEREAAAKAAAKHLPKLFKDVPRIEMRMVASDTQGEMTLGHKHG